MLWTSIDSKKFGGSIIFSKDREFGKREIRINKNSPLINKIYSKNKKYNVWMSHSDHVNNLPNGFDNIASTETCNSVIIQNLKKKIFGVQFHPEVVHTFGGKEILENFVLKICGCEKIWNMRSFQNEMIVKIKELIKDDKVVCGLSGGVDSTVTAVLVERAIGKNLKCLLVDTGLMRKDEVKNIRRLFTEIYDINLTVINEKKLFLSKLKGVKDPEKKEKL